ncbi:biotin carboxyl carrier protein of acetyl-CoA carboxylase [Sporocytophaga myxococcoides]|uniref:Biotin carboxyl carrier protein of acetyl-CoA carboxylase n=1 Tax=Sporocytophaga myxococcoides TaxID=153721 RepID=A0A098LEW8_9BACT|nr:acetyl-CoA carboxylase biotin carboxyl carrier protein [Sporocytophaga myxococcoides]GAL84974.1 biotin carboxyl carrier protein of acetyl-CoA carboxylase [Sporocytophaga myxococcoides]
MKAKEIQELLDFIASSGLAEVNIETEQFKIAVKKYSEPQALTVTQVPQAIAQPVAPAQATAAQPAAQPKVETPSTPADSSNKNLITIKSPMIGTFYRSANPDSPSFVNVGDEVKQGQTVCIIEAMKLFNEIESEVSGKIVKVLVENATPVEYDQPLFLVEPK